MALTAALLGWMFDGLEMGLFPLVARPALRNLFGTDLDPKELDPLVSHWFAIATAGFLVGAATGGVLFGWLGDRLGRVRAMTLSVATYALFTGLCGLAESPHQIAVWRFIAALGMGGEWALGVALVMEIWPNRSRALLAGLIGAAANFGYMAVGFLSLGLTSVLGHIEHGLGKLGLSPGTVDWLTAFNGWRILMLLGATPALLTFFIRLFVPESEKWQQEQSKGRTSNWATQDLFGVLIGAAGALGLIGLWAVDVALGLRLAGSAVCLVVLTAGYVYPVWRYLHRSEAGRSDADRTRPLILKHLALGACLSGVALLGTWASIQWASVWADKLTEGKLPEAKAWTQIASSFGAVVGTVLAALLGDWIGRRLAYFVLCLTSLGSSLLFFLGNIGYGPFFLFTAFLAGACTASFYGWLPLYLPELFPTRVRATGQGFGFNFGRILAAVGVLQMPVLLRAFDDSYPKAGSIMSLIYLVGLGLIWLAPETRGRPLPE
jgi:MFS family permease